MNESVNYTGKNLAVAIGCFDAVHTGHKKVIERVLLKKKEDLTPTVYTFCDNPKSVIRGKTEKNIISYKEKYQIFEDMGIELVYGVKFDSVREFSPEQFVNDILLKKLHTKYVVCGFNFTFGRKGVADANDLKRLCRLCGIEVDIVNQINYHNMPISSTRIRRALECGDMDEAIGLLGRPFKIKSVIVKENKLYNEIYEMKKRRSKKTKGKIVEALELDFMIPHEGVYLSCLNINGETYSGITYIQNYTAWSCFKGYTNESLYGKTLFVEIIKSIL